MNCPTCGLDIDEHPANRCLDVWVAEEVMGWYYDPKLDTFATPENPGVMAGDVPEYSTDIAAAWTGLEKLLDNGYYFTIKPHCFYKPAAWLIYLDTVPEVIGATLPLAICRAALKVVGKEGR